MSMVVGCCPFAFANNADALTRFDETRLKAIEGMEENLVKRNVMSSDFCRVLFEEKH